MSDTIDIDRIARVFASRYGVNWATLDPVRRDECRRQVSELLTYIDSTAFQGFFRSVAGNVTEAGEGSSPMSNSIVSRSTSTRKYQTAPAWQPSLSLSERSNVSRR